MKYARLGSIGISLLVACGSSATGEPSAPGVNETDSNPLENSEADSEQTVDLSLTDESYAAGNNVATVEDRGADCAIPQLPAFADLEAIATLPDPFLSLDGTRITSKEQWACRRAEIAAQFQEYEVGPKPVRPELILGALDGDSFTVTVADGGDTGIAFTATVTPPETGTGPFPAMIVLGGGTALNDGGNISGQGVTMIQFPHQDVASQAGASSQGVGLFYELYGNDHPAGAMAAWAWGVSRLIDALEKTPEANVDTTRLGVTGCSRNGKGALVVGALDERIALTLPQESGAGGSSVWRMSEAHQQEWIEANRLPDYAAVQTLSSAAGENVWFRESFDQFGDAVDKLPFDHHMVMGLVAPRALLTVNNTDQYWLDRRASHFGSLFAHSIWEALGLSENMGGSQIGDDSHCSVVPAEQMEHVAAYVGKFLVGGGEENTEIMFTDGGFPDVTDEWVSWATPELD